MHICLSKPRYVREAELISSIATVLSLKHQNIIKGNEVNAIGIFDSKTHETHPVRAKLNNILGIALVICTLPQTAMAQSALQLEQQSKISGPLRVVVNSDAIKILEVKSGVVVISQKPDWSVTIFNPSNKRVFKTALSRFQGNKGIGMQTLFTAFNGTPIRNIPIEPAGADTTCGLKSQKLLTPAYFQKRVLDEYHQKKSSGSTPKEVDYKILDDKILDGETLPAEECNVLARVTGCAEKGKLPLSLTYKGVDFNDYDWLTTTKTSRITTDKKTFASPSDYTPVKSEAEIVQTKATAEGVIDLLDMHYGR